MNTKKPHAGEIYRADSTGKSSRYVKVLEVRLAAPGPTYANCVEVTKSGGMIHATEKHQMRGQYRDANGDLQDMPLTVYLVPGTNTFPQYYAIHSGGK